MGLQKHTQTNFTAGEISPLLVSRTDISKYNNGAANIENMQLFHMAVYQEGRAQATLQRPKIAQSSQGWYRISIRQKISYVLCFEENVIRVFTDRGRATETPVSIASITQANPGVITANSHGFSDGDHVIFSTIGGMTELNNVEFIVANSTTNTFRINPINEISPSNLDTTNYSAYTSGGFVSAIIEIPTSYLESEIQELRFSQLANTLYIAHQNHKPAKLTRSSATSWSLTDTQIEDGPFRPINGDPTKIIYFALGTIPVNISNITTTSPIVCTTSSNHNYQSGDCITFSNVGGMTQLNGNRYIVTRLTDTTFALRGMNYRDIDGTSGFSTYTSGGTSNRSVTKWGTYAEGCSRVYLRTNFDYFQSSMEGQLMRFWEPALSTGIQAPVNDQTISNSSVITNDSKVYGLTNLNGTTTWQSEWLPPTHTSGVVHYLSASSGTSWDGSSPGSGSAGSNSNTVDIVYLHDVSCILKIVEYQSSTQVLAEVVKNHISPDIISYGTSAWEEGAWSEYHGYPGVVAFHEQRLWAASTKSDPQTIYASQTNIFESFLDGGEDDNALSFDIASEKVDTIRWMSPGQTLALGTTGSEYSVTANESGQGITPSNVRVKKQTSYGSTKFEPVRVGGVVVFPSRFGDPDNSCRKLREFAYSFETDAFQAQDLTIISEHITGTGIKHMAYAEEPNSIIWIVREDGQLIGCTYEREQDVVGFHTHNLNGDVESLAIMPGQYGDELWVVVKRTVNGKTLRFIEYLSEDFQTSYTREDGKFLDSHITYNGAATTIISGINHLIGETVGIIGDGIKQEDRIVSNDGTITIDSASNVVVGLKYKSIIESLDIDVGGDYGSSHASTRSMGEVYLNLYRSLGGSVGLDASSLADLTYRSEIDGPMQTEPDIYTGFISADVNSKYRREAKIRIETEDPYPFTVLSITAEVETTD